MVCRRPLTGDEIPKLVALGQVVRVERERHGFARRMVAARAGINPQTLARIEWGQRRTRADTLTAIGIALADLAEEPPLPIVNSLFRAAAGCLAEPSQYQDRVDRRRLRRFRRAANLHEQRRREHTWELLKVLERLLDWLMILEYRNGERDWLPRGLRPIGTPGMWERALYELAARAPVVWQPPALLSVLTQASQKIT